MKVRLFLLATLALLTAVLLAFRFHEKKPLIIPKTLVEAKKNSISCGPDWQELEKYFEETDIPPIAGSGTHTWKINTSNDSAQFYFNQGMNMYYSFHIIEGMASFKKASRLDPNNAMLYWAQALAYGPNINDLGYSASPEALLATQKAVELSAQNNQKEKMLISAMQVRYSEDSTQLRDVLNQHYVDKMKLAYEKYPNDPDVAALYADALMLQHPWDLWNINGTPKPWTPRIREVLEKMLVKFPNHPGANHYYIHVMEPSPFAAKALPSANRLGKITPGLSHTVHMPSHIYLRTGQYNKGVTVNENAVNSYKKIIPIYQAVTANDFLYLIHNLHMQCNNAMMAGRMNYSIQSALETVKTVPKDYLSAPGGLASYMQAIYMLPIITDVRFSRWKEILEQPRPEDNYVYANVFYHFARGMALAQLARLPEATIEFHTLQSLVKDSVLKIPFPPFSPAVEGARVAEKLLEGTIALAAKKFPHAILAYSKAVMIEDSMIYTEPRDWILNPRHFLGKAYLLAGQFPAAEKVFAKDLENNNENPWALRGLYMAKVGQMKKDASQVLPRFNKAASRADYKITGPAL